MNKIDIIVAVGIITILFVIIYTSDINKLSIKNKNDTVEIPIQRINITDVLIKDEFGYIIKRDIKVNTIILIEVQLRNLENKTQPIVCIVKVEKDGIIYLLSYTKSELSARRDMSVANSWIPNDVGEYNIYIFVWSDINGKEVLAPTKILKVKVIK